MLDEFHAFIIVIATVLMLCMGLALHEEAYSDPERELKINVHIIQPSNEEKDVPYNGNCHIGRQPRAVV